MSLAFQYVWTDRNVWTDRISINRSVPCDPAAYNGDMSYGPSPHSLSHSQETLEQRRQIALRVARENDRLLRRSKFGATDVVLFGSLAGQSPWHWESDIDLAVSGLTFEQWLKAADAVQAIAPDWLAIDVVRTETLNSAVYRRVFQLDAMPQNKFLNLESHLADEVYALEQCIEELNPALKRAKEQLTNYDIRALATYVNDFYRDCERMSERVAVALDGGLPRSENWHQALLRQLAEPRGDNRPRLWSQELLADLDEYRRFRHVVHHQYGDRLQAEKVLTLAEHAPQIAAEVKIAIARFNK